MWPTLTSWISNTIDIRFYDHVRNYCIEKSSPTWSTENHPSAKELNAKTLPMTANQITCPRSQVNVRIVQKCSESFPKNFPENHFRRDLFFLATKRKSGQVTLLSRGLVVSMNPKYFIPPGIGISYIGISYDCHGRKSWQFKRLKPKTSWVHTPKWEHVWNSHIWGLMRQEVLGSKPDNKRT